MVNVPDIFWGCYYEYSMKLDTSFLAMCNPKKVCDGIIHCSLQVAAFALILVLTKSFHSVQLEDYFTIITEQKRELKYTQQSRHTLSQIHHYTALNVKLV